MSQRRHWSEISIKHLDGGELLEHGAWGKSRGVLAQTMVQRDVEAISQEGYEDLGFDTALRVNLAASRAGNGRRRSYHLRFRRSNCYVVVIIIGISFVSVCSQTQAFRHTVAPMR